MATPLPVAVTPPPVAPALPADLVAELAGRYRLEGRIGEGGMGVVYRATSERDGSTVAIKVLRAQFSRDPSVIERFRREAVSAARVDSPHVVSVLDFGRLSGGSAYLVMEHLEGEELGALLHELGVFDWDRARAIVLQLCQVLGRAHAAGIVHRDLKPENVLVLQRDGGDFVKVVDFGIAKIRGEAVITMAGSALGTPGFMSPEQCAGEVADHRSDVYALGVMLYEMLAGELPFEHESLPRMLMAHVTEIPALVRSHASYLPEALDGVLARCLAKKPAARYQSMEAFADALRAIERQEVSEVRARPSAPTLMDMVPPVAASVRPLPRAIEIAPASAEPAQRAASAPAASAASVASPAFTARPALAARASAARATVVLASSAAAPRATWARAGLALAAALGALTLVALVALVVVRPFDADAATPAARAVRSIASPVIASPVIASPVLAAPVLAPVIAAPVLPVVVDEVAPTPSPVAIEAASAPAVASTNVASSSSPEVPTPAADPIARPRAAWWAR